MVEGIEDFDLDDLNLVRRQFPGRHVTLDGDVITVWPKPLPPERREDSFSMAGMSHSVTPDSRRPAAGGADGRDLAASQSGLTGSVRRDEQAGSCTGGTSEYTQLQIDIRFRK
ncbi:hypothetical protein [Streptomyces sp. SYSU K21746]